MNTHETVNLAIDASLDDQDPMAALEAIEALWKAQRDPKGKANDVAECFLRAARAASRTSATSPFKRPPYLLLQTAAVVVMATATPWDADRAEAAASDPAAVLQRWATSGRSVERLRALTRPRIPTVAVAVAVASALGGIALGWAVSRGRKS